ncbi:hypothetical protein FOZ60_008237 [Perkinsus olseni]|uniref:ATP-dependent DNA helicase n=1 Tax=Perkinsus olseni TaxID=32597 RepID=A0A7J6PF47_PEROL|nr:hypothetical protein FOZ60_008237 [Perkinsus olseni]
MHDLFDVRYAASASEHYGLDPDQRRAFDKIVESVEATLDEETRPDQRYFYITGYAGTGKSHLLKSIIQEIGSDPRGPHQVILAWNGMSAKQVGGVTVMSYFSLGFDDTSVVGDNSYMRSTEELTRRMVRGIKGSEEEEQLRKGAVIYVDEVIALHHTIVDAMSATFKQIRHGRPSSQLPFGGLAVVFCGDPCQIGRVALFEGSALYGPEAYPTFPFWRSSCWAEMGPTVMYLTRFNRGADSDYLGLLKDIRNVSEEDDGVPMFTDTSLRVLAKIRDRDGGRMEPR